VRLAQGSQEYDASAAERTCPATGLGLGQQLEQVRAPLVRARLPVEEAACERETLGLSARTRTRTAFRAHVQAQAGQLAAREVVSAAARAATHARSGWCNGRAAG
jgi:hypothetical protein